MRRCVLGLLLLCGVAMGQALPDAPQPQIRHRGFFAVRRQSEPPLETNRQILRDPKFMVTHVLAFGASAINVSRSRAAGATYQDAMIGIGVVSVFDYLVYKYLHRPVGLGGAMYTIGLRGYGAATKTYK